MKCNLRTTVRRQHSVRRDVVKFIDLESIPASRAQLTEQGICASYEG